MAIETKKPYRDYTKPQPAPVTEDVKVEAHVEAIPAVDEGLAEKAVEAPSKEVEAPVPATKIFKVVKEPALNVREAPNISARAVDTIYRGQKVEVLGESGEFTKIGRDRYVMTMYLV